MGGGEVRSHQATQPHPHDFSIETDAMDPSIPKERSRAHHLIAAGKAVFLSLDIEHAGEYVGVIQLSAELFRLDLLPNGTGARSDTAANIRRCVDTFNKYVKPESSMEWDSKAVQTHGLTASDQRISGADTIGVVWSHFCLWLGDNVAPDESCILIAWNGEGCDLKWLWKLTQAPGSRFVWPGQVKFFMDPLRVIKKFTGCRIHPSKSKIENLELGVVWKHLNDGRNLNGAHDSMVDARAQTDIVIHNHFVPYINRTHSIQPMAKMFGARNVLDWKKKMEPAREIHAPWKEQKRGDAIKWEPLECDRYTGASGGGMFGPSTFIKDVARGADSLACIFLALVPLSFFSKVR